MRINLNLFKNSRKEKETHPDYRGDGKDENGAEFTISAWVKEGKNGKYFSCAVQEKQDYAPNAAQAPVPAARVEDKDDLPF